MTDIIHPEGTRRPLIMITNDDGIHAKGIRDLIEMIRDMADIVVVAPDAPRSGQSSAITVETPLRIHRHDQIDGAETTSVNGTPVDCVKLGLHAVVRRRPDLLIAGINHGSNAGNSVIYSGTMGAVMEGCMVGIPSIGFSLLDHRHDADFSPCRPFVREIVAKVLEHGLPDGVCLNVNIPLCGEPKGMKVAKAARGYWTEEYADYVDPHGHPYYWLTGHFHNLETDNPSTDEYWLARQWVSVVPVRVDQTAPSAVVEGVRSVLLGQ
ncbi:MAG: 5'/3'-nucleotidase SurE [Clostridium sp.]|nr:5'/3'-nucleotidase SurE [Clostridium sp.]